MPIGSYLDGQKFDGETIRQMGIAFELAGLAPRRPRLERPPSCGPAQRIIALAKAGERDAELCDGALRAVRPTSIRRARRGGGRPRRRKLRPAPRA